MRRHLAPMPSRALCLSSVTSLHPGPHHHSPTVVDRQKLKAKLCWGSHKITFLNAQVRDEGTHCGFHDMVILCCCLNLTGLLSSRTDTHCPMCIAFCILSNYSLLILGGRCFNPSTVLMRKGRLPEFTHSQCHTSSALGDMDVNKYSRMISPITRKSRDSHTLILSKVCIGGYFLPC